jgi:hypothetical protein
MVTNFHPGEPSRVRSVSVFGELELAYKQFNDFLLFLSRHE